MTIITQILWLQEEELVLLVPQQEENLLEEEQVLVQEEVVVQEEDDKFVISFCFLFFLFYNQTFIKAKGFVFLWDKNKQRLFPKHPVLAC